jgi:hypothetical protein
MYRTYEEQACYMRSNRQRAMASRNREAQAVALALPQTRHGFTSFAPASFVLSFITSLSLLIISLIIVVSLVLILLGL